MTYEQLNSYNVSNYKDILNIINPILQHRQELYERYSRKTQPTETMGHIISGTIISFEYYIATMVKGYLSGKAPMYNVSKKEKNESYAEEYSNRIDKIRRYNDDGALFTELMHDYVCTAAAYMYIYENEQNEIVYAKFDSRQTVGIFDYSTPQNLIGVVRTWARIENNYNKINVVEIITDEMRTQYTDGKGITEQEILSWGDVPCVAMEEQDGISVYEPALSSITMYEKIVNNIQNMTAYNADIAKLLLINYSLPEKYITDDNGESTENEERKKLEEELYKSKVLAVNNDGDIRWLLKEVDYTGLLSVIKQLHEQITMLTGVPNMTDEAFSRADNATALGYKLYPLDQYSSNTDRIFRKGYLRLWEVITNRLNLKGGNYDFRDIDIIMQRNIPTDKDKSIARAAMMKSSGLFSDETCINESQVEVDAADEIERRNAEETAEYEKFTARNEVNEDETIGESER